MVHATFIVWNALKIKILKCRWNTVECLDDSVEDFLSTKRVIASH